MARRSLGTVAAPLSTMPRIWDTPGPYSDRIPTKITFNYSLISLFRSYITFDILRRVLSGYFGYDIFYVMNITDIDDKIIKRARQNYLYEQYSAEDRSLHAVLSDARQVLTKLSQTAKSTTDADKKQMFERLLVSLNDSIENLENAVKSGDTYKVEEATDKFVKDSKDPLSDWLDAKLGATVTDNAIFAKLPQYWEEEFHKDMDALNVKR